MNDTIQIHLKCAQEIFEDYFSGIWTSAPKIQFRYILDTITGKGWYNSNLLSNTHIFAICFLMKPSAHRVNLRWKKFPNFRQNLSTFIRGWQLLVVGVTWSVGGWQLGCPGHCPCSVQASLGVFWWPPLFSPGHMVCLGIQIYSKMQVKYLPDTVKHNTLQIHLKRQQHIKDVSHYSHSKLAFRYSHQKWQIIL